MVLGEGIVNPVNEKGKADFGVDIGDVLQLQYIDKDPPHGWRKHLNKVFTCKVERYLVEKVVRKKGEVVAGGSVVVNLFWVGGPPACRFHVKNCEGQEARATDVHAGRLC